MVGNDKNNVCASTVKQVRETYIQVLTAKKKIIYEGPTLDIYVSVSPNNRFLKWFQFIRHLSF